MLSIKKTIDIIKILEKYPVELIIAKQLILAGADTEEKISELLKAEYKISDVTRIRIQNRFRDMMFSKIVDFEKVPNIFNK